MVHTPTGVRRWCRGAVSAALRAGLVAALDDAELRHDGLQDPPQRQEYNQDWLASTSEDPGGRSVEHGGFANLRCVYAGWGLERIISS